MSGLAMFSRILIFVCFAPASYGHRIPRMDGALHEGLETFRKSDTTVTRTDSPAESTWPQVNPHKVHKPFKALALLLLGTDSSAGWPASSAAFGRLYLRGLQQIGLADQNVRIEQRDIEAEQDEEEQDTEQGQDGADRTKARHGLSEALTFMANNVEVIEKLVKLHAIILALVTRLGRYLSVLIPYIIAWARDFPRVNVVDLLGTIQSEDAKVSMDSCYEEFEPKLLPHSASAAKPSSSSGSPGIINLERYDAILTRAFKARGTRAVVLRIDSPGGSPVQSSLIYQRLCELRKEYKHVSLLAFVEDMGTSGAYYIASAADEIIADPSSAVGSIGVVIDGFGYVKRLKRQGITRRLRTAGKNKRIHDPYLRERRRDLALEKRRLEDIHSNFITAVKEGRGDRLNPEEAAKLYWNTTASPRMLASAKVLKWLQRSKGELGKRQFDKLVKEGAGLFDGSLYTGEVARKLGLVDEVGELRTEMRKRFGPHVQLQRVKAKGFTKLTH